MNIKIVGNHWTNIEKTIIVDKTNMQKIRGEILDVLGMSQKRGGYWKLANSPFMRSPGAAVGGKRFALKS